MTTVQITAPGGKAAGAVELPAEIFDAQANIPLMHQVVVAQLAAARQGTHATKTRGDVSGGGKKPYRQKGTGRARQGSTRAPQFTGGGVSHGPVPHGYLQRTPKKMKAAALRGALSDRAREGRVHVLSALIEGDIPSTKTAAATIAALNLSGKILVVVDRTDEAGWKSLRNLQTVHLISSDQLNTYDVLVSDDVVFTKSALDEFLAFAGAGEATAAPVADAVESADDNAAEVDSADGNADEAATDEGPADEAVEPAVDGAADDEAAEVAVDESGDDDADADEEASK